TRSDRDWSSDVCSSDLGCADHRFERYLARPTRSVVGAAMALAVACTTSSPGLTGANSTNHTPSLKRGATAAATASAKRVLPTPRSEERRVGKACRARGR